MKLYGIPNCDTVKKARSWLADANIGYEWHDFKKQGVTSELLGGWAAQVGWEKLVNKAGTTWRKLDDATKAGVVDTDSAIALMMAQPSVIKRPVLDSNGTISVGFSTERYEALLK
ncbi:Regulatory protein Spx [Andreprevotia sp. IGB-42]|uniref:ArsC family reductase n=1 Tax=Andreprevotia sp. IGB-42 TaxID=2497473 RepID=UPI00135B9F78|nr:ArsC family reductase [Andreprevotia sp. IGB-42]KAF0815273.1 Regulatory protein Spx [Andreprevotia sp. IGB-42]